VNAVAANTLAWLGRIPAALPDIVFAGAFLITWISPFELGPDAVKNLMLTMLLEFLVMHSGAFIGRIALAPGGSRLGKSLGVLGFGAFYTLFVLAFVKAFGTWWPLWNFLFLLASRFASIWFVPSADHAARQWGLWIWSVLAYLLGCFATIVLPLPALGLTPEAVASLHLKGRGLWIDHPHTVIAFGAFYFSAMALVKLTWSERMSLVKARA
jgi:hypothetical protein